MLIIAYHTSNALEIPRGILLYSKPTSSIVYFFWRLLVDGPLLTKIAAPCLQEENHKYFMWKVIAEITT